MMINGANGAKRMVQIVTEDAKLEGTISLPADAKGLVILAQGRGGSRFSSTLQYVTEALFQNNIASLCFEMLTPQEEELYLETHQLPLDLLARRVMGATDWVMRQPQLCELPLGYFGEDIGASATIVVATERACVCRALVTHGELIDMPKEVFSKLQTPIRLVVDENDLAALNTNQALYTEMSFAKDFKTIPDSLQASQKCESLKALATLATDWYQACLDPQILDFPNSNSYTVASSG